MARRKKGGNADGGVLILLAAAVMTAIFLLRLAITAGALLGPVALVLLYVGSLRGRRAPTLHPPSAFDDRNDRRLISDLVDRCRAKRLFIREQYAIGFANDLMLTAKSDGRLFHAGSRLGKELNTRLEDGFEAASKLGSEIKQIRHSVLHRMPDWRGPIERWAAAKRLNAAAGIGIMAAAIALIASTASGLPSPETSSSMSAAMLWNPTPDILGGTYLTATAVALIVTGGSFIALGNHTWAGIDETYVSRWRALEAEWQRPIEDDDDFVVEPENSFDSAEDPTLGEAWYRVLNVDPDAEIGVIRVAYRDLIKAYHPDLVAALGPRLREVAERESKRINSAYSEAQSIRGFR